VNGLASGLDRNDMPALVSLRSVSRIYRTDSGALTAVRDVNFDIGQGETVAIMGPSGSGKSTLMNMIGLLDAPSEGRIYLEGVTVADLPEDERSGLRARKLGFVFQSYNLLARYNAIENVELPLVYSGVDRARRACRGVPGSCENVAPGAAFPEAAVRWRTAESSDRALPGLISRSHSG
jgi:putative ABC transport system ATP-binding protein